MESDESRTEAGHEVAEGVHPIAKANAAPCLSEGALNVSPHDTSLAEKGLKSLQDTSVSLDTFDWDKDHRNPRNWTRRKKWIMVLIVSYYTLISPLSSSSMAPGLPEIAIKYNISSPTIVSLTLSVFLLSFAIGPLFLAPLSEMYGRTWVYHIANIFSIVFALGCAYSPNTATLIAMRFLTGFSASIPVSIGGSTISDIFPPSERASAMSLYTMGALFGPAIGPVAGGFLVQRAGIKWVFIVSAGAAGLGALIGIPILKETYAPIIIQRIAKEEGRELPRRSTSQLRYIWLNLTRPILLLTTSLICFLLSLYMAFQYGIYYLMFATFPDFFHDTYGFSPGTGGLVYLGIGIGFIAGTLLTARWGDWVYMYFCKRNEGIYKPEMRMPVLIAGAVIVPIGLFWYGWSAEAKLHWMMPIVGSAIYAFGMIITYMPINLYLVDAYNTYAASALGAASVFRSLFGFAFPLFARQLYDGLGMGGATSLLAGLAIILGVPFGLFIYFYGERLRLRSGGRFTK